MDFDKGLVSGTTMLLLLELLREQDRYGYEIIQQIEQRSDKTFSFKEGTLYPVLHKLEGQGLIRGYQQTGENGKNRKYYAITHSGQSRLVAEKKQWVQFTASVNKVMGGACLA